MTGLSLEEIKNDKALMDEIRKRGRVHVSDPFYIARIISHLRNGVLSKSDVMPDKDEGISTAHMQV